MAEETKNAAEETTKNTAEETKNIHPVRYEK